MNIVLFDNANRSRLFPLTLTRAIGGIRIGIFTIKERWERITNQPVFVLTAPELKDLYASIPSGDCLFIDATIKPEKDLVDAILSLKVGEGMRDEHGVVAVRKLIKEEVDLQIIEHDHSYFTLIYNTSRIIYPSDIFKANQDYILFDCSLIGDSANYLNDCNSTIFISSTNIFIEEGAKVEYSILNASAGPIYIGKNATVMEGSLIRGPFVLGEGSTVKMGTKVYGATTVGPFSVIGGEVKNSVIFGFSNKGHDGYLGDSVIGEWCNMGAGTSNSNLKNTGGDVRVWSYFQKDYISAGMKCGVIMGDYSRTAINTSINTGTVIGTCCNVFGSGLTPKHIPDFAWGFNDKEQYNFDKALQDISNWKKMKNKILTEPETKVLRHIFENTINEKI